MRSSLSVASPIALEFGKCPSEGERVNVPLFGLKPSPRQEQSIPIFSASHPTVHPSSLWLTA